MTRCGRSIQLLTSKRRRISPDEPTEKPKYKLDVRGLIIMVLVASVSGPVNFVLGFTVWVFAQSFLPVDPPSRSQLDAPVTIFSQFLVALLVIGVCGWAVSKFSSLPYGWGIALGAAIAFATNPLVLLTLS